MLLSARNVHDGGIATTADQWRSQGWPPTMCLHYTITDTQLTQHSEHLPSSRPIYLVGEHMLQLPRLWWWQLINCWDNFTDKRHYLFHFAEFVHASLIPLHAVLGQVQMSRVTIQLLLILRHLLDHLWEVTHWRLVLWTHAFLVTELLQFLGHLSDNIQQQDLHMMAGYSCLLAYLTRSTKCMRYQRGAEIISTEHAFVNNRLMHI